MQTVQQQRAKYALDAVEVVVNRLKNRREHDLIKASEYVSYASAFPAMIKMNGLGQAAAFYCSKGKDEDSKAQAYDTLYKTLSTWLSKPGQPYEGVDLIKGITEKEMPSYMQAQAEALMFLDWLKKFAKAYMPDEKNANKTPPQEIKS
jgi:CRISPR-associated protein Cmr5